MLLVAHGLTVNIISWKKLYRRVILKAEGDAVGHETACHFQL